MAATLLADGTFELTNVPDIADVAIMGDLLDGDRRVDRAARARTGSSLTNHGDLTPVAPYELVERIRASINVLGPLLARCGHVRLSHAGRRRLRRPPDRHARRRARGDGRDVQVQPRVPRGLRRAAARRRHHVRLPERRRHREHVTAAVLAEGPTDDRQRRPRARDRRPVRVPRGDGCADLGASAPRRWSIDGVERGSLRAVAHRTVPDRIQAATYLAAVAVAGGEIDDRAAPDPSTWRCCSTGSPTWASRSRR